jgi:hypothetical protein
MEFVITSPNTYNRSAQWFGNNARYETTTDVKFLDDNTLVVADRRAAMLQLIEFDITTKTIKVIDTVSLIYTYDKLSFINGKIAKVRTPEFPDLITIHNNTVYIASLNNTVTTVQIVNRKFMKPKLIKLNNNGSYHGITINPTAHNILYLSSALYTPKLVICDLNTLKTQDVILDGFKNKPLRQTRFLDDTHIVCVGGDGIPSNHKPTDRYNSYVGVYSLPNFKCIDIVTLHLSHIDDVCVYNDNIYVVYQSDAQSKVLNYKFINNKLVHIRDIPVGGFPHGIDARNNLLAVTSMTRSSVQLIVLFP